MVNLWRYPLKAEEYKKIIEDYLSTAVPGNGTMYSGLADSMRYSLMAGGKRIRPMLALEFARMLGEDINNVMPVACALEMIHTYSLIHDDLPCMDNDELRRGKPTNHVVYGESTAVLAGDALQSLAFSTLFKASLPAERLVKCAALLADSAGIEGMCGGQFGDIAGEGVQLTEQQLTAINDLKTGALLSCACMLGTAAAGGTDEQLEAARMFGTKLGLAFQIRDDILDVISTDEELGKPVGSDESNCKNTYMHFLGLEKCEEYVKALTDEAVGALETGFDDTEFLKKFAYSLADRKY